jgi:hypothetical protein
MERDKQRVMKALFALLVIATLFGVVGTIQMMRAGSNGEPGATISVTGKGEVSAIPDVATFNFSVVTDAKDASTAQEENAKSINAILGFLKDEGVLDKDIQTSNYSTYPQYEYIQTQIYCVTYPCPQPPGKQELKGYQTRQTVEVTVRNTEHTGTLLSGVGERGATDMSGIRFTIDDEDGLIREARQKAIDEAQEKAHQLAKDLDVRLVRIVSYYENENNYLYRDGYAGIAYSEDSVSVPKAVPEIPTGENIITRTVNITYEIR